jgi:hypothetical protein
MSSRNVYTNQIAQRAEQITRYHDTGMKLVLDHFRSHAAGGPNVEMNRTIHDKEGIVTYEFTGFLVSPSKEQKSEFERIFISRHAAGCSADAYPCTAKWTTSTGAVQHAIAFLVTKKIRVPYNRKQLAIIAAITLTVVLLLFVVYKILSWIHTMVHGVEIPWLFFKL